MSVCLTEEQRRKIEENRQKALARRAERLAAQKSGVNQTAPVSSNVQASIPQQFGGSVQQNKQKGFNVPPTAKELGQNNSVTLNPSKTGSFNLHSVGGANRGVPAQVSVGSAQNYSSPAKTEAQSSCQNAPVSLPVAPRLDFQPQNFGATAAPNQIHEPSKPNSYKSADAPPGAGKDVSEPVKSTSNVSQFYSKSSRYASAAGNKTATDGREKAGGSVLDTAQAKKPGAAVKGRCVKHAEDRFRVEVGYKAELIALFKTIPSKNYGELVLW